MGSRGYSLAAGRTGTFPALLSARAVHFPDGAHGHLIEARETAFVAGGKMVRRLIGLRGYIAPGRRRKATVQPPDCRHSPTRLGCFDGCSTPSVKRRTTRPTERWDDGSRMPFLPRDPGS
jgi:hypothetical protein